MKEHELIANRLDYSHQFAEPEWPVLLCAKCGKIRPLHAHDGFVPSRAPSIYTDDPAVQFRGAHPRWSRPQSVRVDKAEEAEIAASPERRAQAQRIRDEEARQMRVAIARSRL